MILVIVCISTGHEIKYTITFTASYNLTGHVKMYFVINLLQLSSLNPLNGVIIHNS